MGTDNNLESSSGLPLLLLAPYRRWPPMLCLGDSTTLEMEITRRYSIYPWATATASTDGMKVNYWDKGLNWNRGLHSIHTRIAVTELEHNFGHSWSILQRQRHLFKSDENYPQPSKLRRFNLQSLVLLSQTNHNFQRRRSRNRNYMGAHAHGVESDKNRGKDIHEEVPTYPCGCLKLSCCELSRVPLLC